MSQILTNDGPVARDCTSMNDRPMPSSICLRAGSMPRVQFGFTLSVQYVPRHCAVESIVRKGQRVNGICSVGLRSIRRSPESRLTRSAASPLPWVERSMRISSANSPVNE